ncbi:DNA repair and recombination protein RadB [uncultured archaeon]|nr:DNA repair and recombination protein RadB [uncultured archaeon]
MRDKHPIHTTLNTDAMRVLERYEKEFGAMNTVIERALMGMDKLRFREKIDAQSINRIIKRVKTGIPGFDELIEGGIPEGSVVVLTGPPGTGKTTFSMQFLMDGLKNNERCIFFSFEEKVEQLIKSSLRFGWDIGRYIDKGYLEVFGFTMHSTEEIIEILDIFKPNRVVFDSINIFSDLKDLRRSTQWRNILKKIKELRIISFAITEKRRGIEIREFDDFDFMSDGILFFDKRQLYELDKYKTIFIEIQKMRMTKINEMPHQYIFTEHGIELVGMRNLARKIASSSVNQKPLSEQSNLSLSAFIHS